MIKELETQGKVCCVVTQNVDRLHTKAGSKHVIELHGSAYKVICLDCDSTMDRHNFQSILEEMNPYMKGTSMMIRPDGDVDISQVVNSLIPISYYILKRVVKWIINYTDKLSLQFMCIILSHTMLNFNCYSLLT
jgi:hypothetical protein